MSSGCPQSVRMAKPQLCLNWSPGTTRWSPSEGQCFFVGPENLKNGKVSDKAKQLVAKGSKLISSVAQCKQNSDL